jgi:hypothetical protein
MPCSEAEAEMGVTAKLGFADSDPDSPPVDPTEVMEFQSDDVRERRSEIRTDGIRGTVAVPATRQVLARKVVQGSFRLQPTPTDMSRWITRITGAASGANLAETLPCFDVFALRGGFGFKYRECKVQRAEFSSGEGQPLSLQIEVLGRQRDDPATAYTWPTLALPAGTPWMFHECVLSIPTGTTYRVKSARVTFDNGIAPRYMNSVTPTDTTRTERNTSISLELPWGTSKALLASFRDGFLATKFVYTQGGNVLTLAAPKCKPMEIEDPMTPSKEETMLPLNLMCRYNTTPGDEMIVTLATA